MDFCDLRLTLNLDSLEPPQGAVASLLPNLRIGSENAKHFAEPPVRFELTAYALRVRCSTPELRWRAAKATLTFYWNSRKQIFG